MTDIFKAADHHENEIELGTFGDFVTITVEDRLGDSRMIFLTATQMNVMCRAWNKSQMITWDEVSAEMERILDKAKS